MERERELLYLPTLDEEAYFVQYLFDLMEQPEHQATAKIVYCRLSGQTAEEFDRRRRRAAELAAMMGESFNTSAR